MGQTSIIDKDDRVLAEKIKLGNQLAFATIYDKYHKQLYALAYRYLKSREMAEDAVQQVFVNFWINRSKINEQWSVKNLLFTSLKNHTLNALRNHQRAIEKNYEILLTSQSFENEEESDASPDMTSLIEKAVDTLSPQRKQIYYLKIVEGLSNQEIAQKLNLSINTVKFQYSQILKEIRLFISKHMISSLVLIAYLFR